MSTHSLEEAVSAMIPKSLDDIVRKNRELCTIRLSRPEEVAALKKTIIADDHHIKGHIEDWRFICLDRCAKADGPMHVLSGFDIRKRQEWATSKITGIDLGTRLVTTHSGSIYKLEGEQGQGEPEMHGLMHIAALLTSWGWSRMLGIPEFFY